MDKNTISVLASQIAKLPDAELEAFHERAAIIQFCGDKPKEEAERLAMQDIRKQQ